VKGENTRRSRVFFTTSWVLYRRFLVEYALRPHICYGWSLAELELKTWFNAYQKLTMNHRNWHFLNHASNQKGKSVQFWAKALGCVWYLIVFLQSIILTGKQNECVKLKRDLFELEFCSRQAFRLWRVSRLRLQQKNISLSNSPLSPKKMVYFHSCNDSRTQGFPEPVSNLVAGESLVKPPTEQRTLWAGDWLWLLKGSW